jgi:release factor glutamine methyltransferase
MKATIKIWIENAIQSLESVSETPQLDSELLLSYILLKNRSWILSHIDQPLSFDQLATADALLVKAVSGKPLPYLLGHWEFFGLDFVVTPDVLIPRPETELLVVKAIEWLRSSQKEYQIADVGTGSGCIAVAIAKNIPNCRIMATDISSRALKIALKNVMKHRVPDQISLVQTNLMDGLTQTFDLICANLPYIPTSRLDHLQVSKVEPLSALDGGNDGFDLIKALLHQAKAKLSNSGCILAEIDFSQANLAISFASEIFSNKSVTIFSDLAKFPRLLMIK